MTRAATVRVRRIYDPVEADDGQRVLVDRIWPRGMSKELARLDEWCKEVAPSTELRKWYAHDPAKFADFRERYLTELASGPQQAAYESLAQRAAQGPLTLLTASKRDDISEATVLAERLGRSR